MSAPKFTVQPKPIVVSPIAPVEVREVGDNCWFLDFGKAAFASLQLPDNAGRLTVHLGEKLTGQGRIDREPPGCIRYCRIEHDTARSGPRLVIPADKRNTGKGAIPMPAHVGEVFPFRYAEIEAAPGFDATQVKQLAAHYPFDDSAAHFECSDQRLNDVWELCKYTIKATTFCGVYVDGDRERIPYEGDAYINQLGHYCTDAEYAMARYSHEYLLQYPTWPTDWQLYSVLMAWEDFCYTGEKESIRQFRGLLKRKTLIALQREDGLISTENVSREFERSLNLWNEKYIFEHGLRDLVDWPPGSFTEGGTGERDNHEMLPINTVVNALHAAACRAMASMEAVIGDSSGMMVFTQREIQIRKSLNEKMWDADRGVYVDGEGSEHASLHSNMFMLALNLVPPERVESVAAFVASRGMACSVYGAQFLLEALFRARRADEALALMTADHDRGWLNMIKAGSTMTWEAWDWKYKNNLDWNHAWGAAPANIIPRWLMGIQPKKGFRQVMIQPRMGALHRARIKHPTPFGPIHMEVDNRAGKPMRVELELPAGVEATVVLPGKAGSDVPKVHTQLTGKQSLS
ncbi:alpha-L-rhamnosidase C-terminal domain-containing protein [Cerasicoccus fimbriatus]|uniref:alpha-L-rhamnosidase-related protein n=1 Tax=Cerasicoccus fimbriatus TaxID=3014554 RepID=UPI0022B2D7A2|nr:alpha-L-rhamnosidase C-terminal domain-containing protein [Cerasicoccus sp. TK19100]